MAAEKAEPTCRTCYAMTLSKYERARFFDEPVTGCIYLCPEHQARMDRALADLPKIEYVKASAPTGALTLPPGQADPS